MTNNTEPLKVGEDTYPQPEHGWTCFHCGETFNKAKDARLHFGAEPTEKPACQIKGDDELGLLRELRWTQKELYALRIRMCDEDLDCHRAMAAMCSDHATALRREEEKGYARGLRDAGYTEPSPAEVSSEGLPSADEYASTYALAVTNDWKLGWNACQGLANYMLAARQTLSQQSPATVEGELTDDEIDALADNFTTQEWGNDCSWLEVDTIGFARAIERALNQRLAVKEGDNYPLEQMLTILGARDWSEALTLAGKFRVAASKLSDEQQAKDAALVDKLREAVEDAAEEFGQMVDVDRAPMTCSKYVLRAFDAALSTTKQEEV